MHSSLVSLVLVLALSRVDSQTPTNITLCQSACFVNSTCSFQGLAFNYGVAIQVGYSSMMRGSGARYAVTMVTKDDSANPATAASNARAFVSEVNKPLILIGEIGTATSQQVASVALLNGVPFVSPVSGALDLRFPFHKQVINIRPSLIDEIGSIADYLLRTRHIVAVGLLQPASGDESTYATVDKVLDAAGLMINGWARFDPSGSDLLTAWGILRRAWAKAVIVSGATSLIGSISKIAVSEKFAPILIFLSTDNDGLIRSLSEAKVTYPGELFFMSVVPPLDLNSTLAMAYRAVLKNQTTTPIPVPHQKPSFIGLEGFLTARFMFSVFDELVARGLNLTADAILSLIFSKGTWVIDGETLGPFALPPFGEDPKNSGCNQGLHVSYLMQIKPGGTVSFVNKWTHRGCGNETTVLKTGTSTGIYIGVSALAAVVVAVIVTVIIIWRRKHRNLDDGDDGEKRKDRITLTIQSLTSRGEATIPKKPLLGGE